MSKIFEYEDDFTRLTLSDEDLSLITEGDYQMIFLSLDSPDYAGHKYSFDPHEPK